MTYKIDGLTGAEHAEFFGPEWYDEDGGPLEWTCPGCGKSVDLGDVCPDCQEQALADYCEYLDRKEEVSDD